jgi:hypothetical protein
MKLKVEGCLLGAVLSALPALAAEPSRLAASDAPSSGEVAPASEPGERLDVTGVVYAADGRTPVGRASVYVYQIVFEDDPFVTEEIRKDAAGPGSIYALRKVEPLPGGGGRVVQDVVLPGP